MLSVLRGSVRANLVLVILVTILLSWVLSGGIASYMGYLGTRALYQEMVKHPELYPQPIPEPEFGIRQFLEGRPPGPGRPGRQRPGPEYRRGNDLQGPRQPNPGPPPRRRFEPGWLILRLSVALGLATLAGVLLGRRFTRPLTQLAEGAEAFHRGDFEYRIPTEGENEFTAVANSMNEMARRVSEQINSLEADAERRRQFMADIAHELRSPVTTMRTMAGALKDGLAEDPERKERAVSALVDTSERLLRLVRDLMELAKLDLNELSLDRRETDLNELALSVIHSYEADALAAGVTLHPPVSTTSVKAVVDPDRIVQVFGNIVENAISYAGKGAEVRFSIEAGEPIRVTVQDTGAGIPSRDLPYIFDSFYRADTARTPGESHSGLGLSIARRLMEAHGGTLDVSSEEGRGTTVMMTLPSAG